MPSGDSFSEPVEAVSATASRHAQLVFQRVSITADQKHERDD